MRYRMMLAATLTLTFVPGSASALGQDALQVIRAAARSCAAPEAMRQRIQREAAARLRMVRAGGARIQVA